MNIYNLTNRTPNIFQNQSNKSSYIEKNVSNIEEVISDILKEDAEICDLKIDLEKCYSEDANLFIDNIYILLYSIFNQLNRVNHSKAIPQKISKSLAEYIEQIISKTPENHRDNLSYSIINLITAHPFDQADDIMVRALDDIISRHSDVLSNLIFTKFSAGIILPLQAIQYIKEEFKAECENKNIHINYEAFDSFDELRDFISNLKKKNEDTRISTVVRHLNSSHITQIFIEKSKGKFNFFISDSIGDRARFSTTTVKEISSIINKIDYEIFVVKDQRQHDHVNCAVYALRDVKQVFKQEDIFSFLKKHACVKKDIVNVGSEENPEEIAVNGLSSLPMEFRRADQSLFELSKYEESLQHPIDPYQSRKIEKIRDFYKWHVFDKNCLIFGAVKEQNSYIVQKRNRIISMIIKKALRHVL